MVFNAQSTTKVRSKILYIICSINAINIIYHYEIYNNVNIAEFPRIDELFQTIVVTGLNYDQRSSITR